MHAGLKSSEIVAIVREEIERMTGRYKPKARQRACLRCSASFALKRDTQVFCSATCARRAHYLPFNVREIRATRKG